MRSLIYPLLLYFVLCVQSVRAQTVVRFDERLDADRPEAWAMNYVAASTFMTSFGASAELAPGRWNLAMELGLIPHLSEAQQRVGFNGFKHEDLNKSPVFGRLRLSLGLPAGWIAELGYTPPVAVRGTRPHDLFAFAVGRRLIERDAWSLSSRIFTQHGSVRGDVTCPARLAGISDRRLNPFGCQAASRDLIALNYWGLDLTAGWHPGTWRWHAGVGAVRTELAVQVDAVASGVRNRPHLAARGVLPYMNIGAGHTLDRHWSLGVEVLYVPLPVKREPDRASENDPFTGLRLQLNYRFD